MKIYLADLVHTFIGARDSRFIPLSVLNIEAYLRSEIDCAEIGIEVFKCPKKLMRAIAISPPDIIGVSNYVWNFHVSKNALKYAKSMNPNVICVMGGPNATLSQPKMYDLLKDGTIDYYVPDSVTGGEKPFCSLVQARLEIVGPHLHTHEGVHGIWYLDRKFGQAKLIEPKPSTTDLEWLPSPFTSGLVDKFFEEGLTSMVETNRGCPFHCSFCVWGNGSKVTQFSVERVISDLDYCAKHSTQKLLMINDANFGLFKRRDLDIAKHIKKLNLEMGWPNNIVVNWGQVRTEATIAVANELKGLTILRQSSQSQNEDVLQVINRNNIPDFQWDYVTSECKKDGIESFAELIVMLPKESLKSYLEGLRYFFNLGIDCVNTNQCQMLEGSELNSEENRRKFGFKTAWRLLEDAYGEYGGYTSIEGEEVVIETNTFSFEESLTVRTLNWLIQMSWTLKRHNIFIKILQEFLINPVDFFMTVIAEKEDMPPQLLKLVQSFEESARQELFPTYAALQEFYAKPEALRDLKEGGFSKLNTLFSGLALEIDSEILEHYLKVGESMVRKQGGDCEDYYEKAQDCISYLMARTLSPEDIELIVSKQDILREVKVHYDFANWERSLENQPLSRFRMEIPVVSRFQTKPEQILAISRFVDSMSIKTQEFRLKRLCEPYYGVKKEFLNLYRIDIDSVRTAINTESSLSVS